MTTGILLAIAIIGIGIVLLGSGLLAWPFVGAILLIALGLLIFGRAPTKGASARDRQIDQPRKRDKPVRRDRGSHTDHPEQHEEFIETERPPSTSESDPKARQ